MRTIKRASAFKSDFRRIKATPRHSKDVGSLLSDVLKLLVVDRPLPDRYRDHPLSGNWNDYRECHIKPDLLLIYRKPDSSTLRLARLGSHSELFG